MRDRMRDKSRIELGIEKLKNVERSIGIGNIGKIIEEILDVWKIIEDDDEGERRMDSKEEIIVRKINKDIGDRRMIELLGEEIEDIEILMKKIEVIKGIRVKKRIKGEVDEEKKKDRINIMKNYEELNF